MKCKLCEREAKKREAFWSLCWDKIDSKEFEEREKDGRTLFVDEVCPECIAKHNNGRPPLGLKDINNIRKRGITNDEYYKEHGY